jgi:cytochrome c-type biogenesis protein CcmH
MRTTGKAASPYIATIVRFLPLLVLGLAFLISMPALAQDPVTVTDDEVNAIAKYIYCPVCENTPLDVCPTQVCAEWRELIREQIAMGWTEAEIRDYFVVRYGDRVLATPPARGLNLLIYIFPPLAILAGGFILVRALRTMKQPVQVSKENLSSASSDDYVKQLEEELRKR